MVVNLDTARNKRLALRGIIIICIISFFLRFWGLGRFNEFVFDEVYYAKFANNYLTNTKFFNSHPPLSQYLIAIGIWIGDRLPIGQETTNMLTGSLHSTFSYRWMNALFGSLILPLVAALAYQLSQKISYAFLAALFVSLDGLFLIESRYALNNIFLIFFGLLGQMLVLLAIKNNDRRYQLFLMCAGISFGASAACKWNGLSFLFGTYLLIIIAKINQLLNRQSSDINNLISVEPSAPVNNGVASIRIIEVITHLIILPIITYSILWIPHLLQNPQPNFIDVQWSILNYHEKVGNGALIHPYCANWYTWPLMMRPLAYHFEDYKPNYYYDVHAMGNPLLWWFALAAVCGSIWLITKDFSLKQYQKVDINSVSIPLFILVNYAANLLPWVKITRCLFIYHYMSAVLFAIMGLAWLVDLCFRSGSKLWQAVGLTTIFSIAGSFVFWLPIYLGLSIEKTDLSLRLWDFWIFNWI